MPNLDLSKKLRTNALIEAVKYHGVSEATGKNDGEMIRYFQEYQDYLKGKPWCSSFVSRMFLDAAKKLGIPRPFPHIPGVNTLYSFARKKGWYHSNTSFIPQPADIFIHLDLENPVRSHTGMIKAIQDNKIITIEGNISNQVSSRRFLKTDSYISGFIRVTV
jgi:hypothetical protein